MKTFTVPRSTRTIFFAIAAFMLTAFQTHAQQFIEGSHYVLLEEVQPVQTGEKIEVVEMFWYRCPHCYRLEPYLIEWQKNIPQNAAFRPVPAVLSGAWEFEARAYYTFEALGIVDELHVKYFNALHQQNIRIKTAEQLQQWVDKQDIGKHDVVNAFSSFAVDNKLNFASLMSRKYGISGVPSIIVDGRYRTSVTLAGSHERLIELINYLIGKAAEQRSA